MSKSPKRVRTLATGIRCVVVAVMHAVKWKSTILAPIIPCHYCCPWWCGEPCAMVISWFRCSGRSCWWSASTAIKITFPFIWLYHAADHNLLQLSGILFYCQLYGCTGNPSESGSQTHSAACVCGPGGSSAKCSRLNRALRDAHGLRFVIYASTAWNAG